MEKIAEVWCCVALAASRIKGVTAAVLEAFYKAVPPAESPFVCTELCSHQLLRRALADRCYVAGLEEELFQLASQGIGLLSIVDPRYPYLLRQIFDPPQLLFYSGNLACFGADVKGVAVVGSRKGDACGCKIAFDLSRELAAGGATVVSGLAAGIDSAAHQGALASHGDTPTIAVLGSGLRCIYPRSNESLARDIVDHGGLIVSQFSPNEPPYPSNFLNRNRVIAGLALGVLVVQAAARSGSLVSARYALEEGREVMAVPGSILDPRYEGSNRLIKEGAHLVSSITDILEGIPGLAACQKERAEEEVVSDNKIIQYLRANGPMRVDVLQTHMARDDSFSQELLELELAGLVVRAPGNILLLGPQ